MPRFDTDIHGTWQYAQNWRLLEQSLIQVPLKSHPIQAPHEEAPLDTRSEFGLIDSPSAHPTKQAKYKQGAYTREGKSR